MSEQINQEVTTTERQKPGRKPLEDKKIPVTIYRPKSELLSLGGMTSVRVLLNEYLNSKKQ